MNMRMLGLLDDKPVFEIDRGKYVIVNPENKKWTVTWLWSGMLGRNYDSFKKCSECEDEKECLKILGDNRDAIVKRLDRVYANVKDGKEYLDDQDRFYESLKDGETYSF